VVLPLSVGVTGKAGREEPVRDRPTSRPSNKVAKIVGLITILTEEVHLEPLAQETPLPGAEEFLQLGEVDHGLDVGNREEVPCR